MRFLIVLVFSFCGYSFAQCDTNSLSVKTIRASDTDSNISWELYKHFTYFNSSCSQRNTLLVHLVGSYDNPLNTKLFPSLAANNGYHVVVLKYPNSTAAQSACANNSNVDCYKNFRQETVEGIDVSSDITVDYTNSITNRLVKLLDYLSSNYPTENWGQYLSNGQIQWQKIIISGHSQGGGHAAYIAKTNVVKRCLMFASPNDYSNMTSSPANWISMSSLTPDSLYYGFNNLNDDVVPFANQYQICSSLPMFGDTLLIDNITQYQNKRQLYTQQTTSGTGGNHSLMIRDSETLLDNTNQPIFTPVWSYMLGIDVGLSVNKIIEPKFSIYPNPTSSLIKVEVNNHQNYILKIFTLNGKLMKEFNTEQSNVFDISDLEKGIYLVELSTKTQQFYQKMVKM